MSLLTITTLDTPTMLLFGIILVVFYLISFLAKDEGLKTFGGFGIVIFGFIIMINIQVLIGLFVLMSGLMLSLGSD